MKMDMVIAVGYLSLQFALSEREGLFNGVPITFCGIERRQLAGHVLPEDVAGALLFYDFRRTVDLAIKLQPRVRDAVCVFGTSEFDLQVGSEALAALAEHPELRVRQIHGVTYAETFAQLRKLPSESIVIYVSMLRDSAGETRLSPAIVKEVCTASKAPVYGVGSHLLEPGLLGGAMMDYWAHGKAIATMAVARLDGKTAESQEDASSPVLVNWRAVKKWRIKENLIPAGAQVRFRPATLWQERRGTIMGIFALLALQSTLITGLLINRAKRERVETALAESIERMNLAAEAANVSMWVWDVSGDDLWMTEQGHALFGLNQDETIDYATVFNQVHPEDRELRETAIKQALETQGHYEMEYRIQASDGAVRWVSARGRCVGPPSGRGQKLLGVSMDVTSRKKSELEAAQQRVELGHLSRVALVGEMATSLAHELNQPLTAIVTNASAAQRFVARDDVDPTELREILSDIAADGLRAGDVIRGIKGMVRKVPGERQTIDVENMISEVLHLVRADALAHNCKLVTTFEPDLPPIEGDGVQLKQVLLNLIINAFDAMWKVPCDPCKVEIVARHVEGRSVEISVRDFGPGLPADGPGRVFESFFSTKGEGMGMGLAIARSIMEAHDGTLTGENADGGGARFWFRIPSSPHVS